MADYSLAPDTNAVADESASVRRLPAPRASLRTGDSVTLDFINRTTNDVKLFWIDPAGDRQNYGVIPGGGEHLQNTYAGHVWLVTSGAGDQLAVFEAGDNGGDAVIGGEQTFQRGNSRRRENGNSNHTRQRPAENSPDGKWSAFIRDNNVFVRDQSGAEFQLSTNGSRPRFLRRGILLVA